MKPRSDLIQNRVDFPLDANGKPAAIIGSANVNPATHVYDRDVPPVLLSHTASGDKFALDVNIAGTTPAVGGNPFVQSGLAAQTPAETTVDINVSLGRNAHNGYLYCDGTGTLSVKFSYDGSTFTSALVLLANSYILLNGLDIDTLKLSGSDATTSYRLIAW